MHLSRSYLYLLRLSSAPVASDAVEISTTAIMDIVRLYNNDLYIMASIKQIDMVIELIKDG